MRLNIILQLVFCVLFLLSTIVGMRELLLSTKLHLFSAQKENNNLL